MPSLKEDRPFVSSPAAKERTGDERWPGKSVPLVRTPADYRPFAAYADKRVKHRGGEYEYSASARSGISKNRPFLYSNKK